METETVNSAQTEAPKAVIKQGERHDAFDDSDGGRQTDPSYQEPKAGSKKSVLEGISDQDIKDAKKDTIRKIIELEKEPGEQQDVEPEKPKKEARDPKLDKESEVKPPKMFKIKAGDKDLDVPADSKWSVKVNGKVEEVTAEELINQYSGKTDWTRKYTDLDKERKSFYSERDSLNQGIQKLHKLAVVDKNPLEAISYLAETLGADPVQIRKQMETELLGQVQAYAQMTPEQRAAVQAQDELDYYKKREQSRKDQETQAQQRQAIEREVETVIETLKITKEDFVKAYGELESFVRSGNLEPQNLNPQYVGEYIREIRKLETVGQVVEANFASSDRKEQIQTRLEEVLEQNPDFTKEDLAEVAIGIFGNPKKTKKSLEEKVLEERKSKSQVKPKREFVSWDDLED